MEEKPPSTFLLDHAGELVVLASPVVNVRWRGPPGGQRVRRFIPVPERDLCVVLADREVASSAPNLFCVDGDGKVLWTADPPTSSGSDHFVAVRVSGETVYANSWSGFLVVLDLRSGGVVRKEFTK